MIDTPRLQKATGRIKGLAATLWFGEGQSNQSAPGEADTQSLQMEDQHDAEGDIHYADQTPQVFGALRADAGESEKRDPSIFPHNAPSPAEHHVDA